MAEGPHTGTSPRRKAPTGTVAHPPNSAGRTPPLCCGARAGKRRTPLPIGGAVQGTGPPGTPAFQHLPLPLIPKNHFILPHSPPSTLQLLRAVGMWRGSERPPSHLTDEDTEALRVKVTRAVAAHRHRTAHFSASHHAREALSPCHRDWERSAGPRWDHEEEEGQHSKGVPSASKPLPVTPNPKLTVPHAAIKSEESTEKRGQCLSVTSARRSVVRPAGHSVSLSLSFLY